MKKSELIAMLQAIPGDPEVVYMHTDNCCCGDCFLPQAFENDVYGMTFDECSGKIRIGD